MKRSGRLFMDETTAPVLDPGRGRMKTGYLWAVLRDDRGHGGADPPIVVYHYAPGRGGEHAEQILGGFNGVLQVDGYAGYHRLARPERKGGAPLRLAWCWSHGRREIIAATPKAGSPVAEAILQRIATLYAVEKEIRARTREPVTPSAMSGPVRLSPNLKPSCALRPRACQAAAKWARLSPISSTTGTG